MDGLPTQPRPAEPIVESGFEPVAALARKHLDRAKGGALCVVIDGQTVVDLWHGPRDPDAGDPWQADTMGMAFSVSKGVVSTLVHLLSERGLVDLDAPVADYWPEFAANGKAGITVSHLLSMEAGLYDVRHLIEDPRQLLDWDTMTGLLAAAAPLHRPGEANAYHAFTYGWLVGEVARRVTGHSVSQMVQDELAVPLGLDGFHIGVPAAELARVAVRPDTPPENRVLRAVAKAADPALRIAGVSPRRFAAAFFPRDADELMASDEFIQAEVPSINGVFTARSLARFYAALGADDGVDGVRLWSPATRQRATEVQNERRDLVVPIRMRWQLGYAQPFPRKWTSTRSFSFYGAFGSGAFADPERGLAVGFISRQAQGMPLMKLVPEIMKSGFPT